MKKLIFILLIAPLSIWAQVEKKGEIIGISDLVYVWDKDTCNTRLFEDYFISKGLSKEEATSIKATLVSSNVETEI